MIRRAYSLLPLLLALVWPAAALAQQEETFTVEESTEAATQPPPTETPPTDTATETETEPKTEKASSYKLGETRVSWQDIVVVKRKPFLKMNRLELMPSFAMTLNDNMIRHYSVNGQVNYYLTDVLAVGVEGQYFTKEFRDTYDLVARQDRRLPTLNQYLWGASLNFSYVPFYAKFAMLNKWIVHLEWQALVGVGVTQSEVIPRDPAAPSWTNMLITPTFGLNTHVFLTRWITLNLSIRDYVFLDRYEAADRKVTDSLEDAKNNADSKLVNHIMFQAGLSLWFPTSFRYTTFR